MTVKMKNFSQVLLKAFALIHFIGVSNLSSPVNSSECSSSRLVLYKVIFKGNWNRKSFPRQYPEWRPPAQWSKVVGKCKILNKT